MLTPAITPPKAVALRIIVAAWRAMRPTSRTILIPPLTALRAPFLFSCIHASSKPRHQLDVETAQLAREYETRVFVLARDLIPGNTTPLEKTLKDTEAFAHALAARRQA